MIDRLIKVETEFELHLALCEVLAMMWRIFSLFSITLILGVLISSCGSQSQGILKPKRSIKMSRVYRALHWETVAALDQRGPLMALIASERDFEHFKIPSGLWIREALIKDLSLKSSYNLRSRQQTSSLSVNLDGLHEAIDLSFTALDPDFEHSLPSKYDLVIPASVLFETEDLDQLCINTEGLLHTENQAACMQSLDQTKLDLGSRAWVRRFKDQWDPDLAYDDRVVALRVDLKESIEIRWMAVNKPLPKDFSVVIDLNADESESPKLIAAQVRKRSSYIPTSWALKTNIKIKDTNQQSMTKRLNRCPPRSPCPLRLVDVIRQHMPCLHDVCVVTLPLPQSSRGNKD